MRSKSKRAKPPRLKVVDLDLGRWSGGHYYHPHITDGKQYLLLTPYGYNAGPFDGCLGYSGPVRFLIGGAPVHLLDLKGLWEIIG